tara:strand:- start:215 stop:538 length:324 start_codon:yes stop_codon:yes gene_type:complete
MDEIKPLTDEEIRQRFTDLSVERIHLKTQFDQLAQSFQIYVNLESKLDDQVRRLESLEKSSNTSITSTMEYASKIQDISSRLDKLEAQLQEEEQEIIYPENPIPQEE